MGVTINPTLAKPALVRAWFDTVLNPIVAGLKTETDLMDGDDLTWRMHRREFAALLPVGQFVTANAQPNLEQFLAVYPQFDPPIERHDSQLRQLRQVVDRFDQNLRVLPQLRELLVASASCASLSPNQGREDWVAEMIPYAAEYIVNGRRSLPNFYSASQFWNERSEEFLQLREAMQVREFWGAVQRERSKLGGAASELCSALKDLRSDLSIRLDVPIAI